MKGEVGGEGGGGCRGIQMRDSQCRKLNPVRGCGGLAWPKEFQGRAGGGGRRRGRLIG